MITIVDNKNMIVQQAIPSHRKNDLPINDILDRICEEIKEHYSGFGAVNDGLDIAIKIIDKYREDKTE